jgi:hypothetical protein
MKGKELISRWVEAFNAANVDLLMECYHEDAINDQVNNTPIEGKAKIRRMFEEEFAIADMVCLVVNIYEDGDWTILEWQDPKGLRGCGFFNIVDGKIRHQRGYWDRLSFLRQQGLPLPVE